MGSGNSTSLKGEEVATFYKVGKSIGEGNFATVRTGTLITSGRKNHLDVAIPAKVAIKTIDKVKVPEDELSLLHDEVDIMHRIHHPNCVALFEVYDSDKCLHLVLECCTGGELFDRIVKQGSFTEKQASGVIRKVAEAVHYLHTLGVVHRDLKPENLLYDSPSPTALIKVTDFG